MNNSLTRGLSPPCSPPCLVLATMPGERLEGLEVQISLECSFIRLQVYFSFPERSASINSSPLRTLCLKTNWMLRQGLITAMVRYCMYNPLLKTRSLNTSGYKHRVYSLSQKYMEECMRGSKEISGRQTPSLVYRSVSFYALSNTSTHLSPLSVLIKINNTFKKLKTRSLLL